MKFICSILPDLLRRTMTIPGTDKREFLGLTWLRTECSAFEGHSLPENRYASDCIHLEKCLPDLQCCRFWYHPQNYCQSLELLRHAQKQSLLHHVYMLYGCLSRDLELFERILEGQIIRCLETSLSNRHKYELFPLDHLCLSEHWA